MKKPKIGRPKSTPENKTVMVVTRVLKKHVDAVDRNARKNNQTRSDRVQMFFEMDSEGETEYISGTHGTN